MHRRKISRELRFTILQRDNYACRICGRKREDNVKLTVDHWKPVSKGGTDDIDNLITLCYDCNQGKNDKILKKPELKVSQKFRPTRFDDRLDVLRQFVESELKQNEKVSIEDVKYFCLEEVKIAKKIGEYEGLVTHLLDDSKYVVRAPSVWGGNKPIRNSAPRFFSKSNHPMELYFEHPADHYIMLKSSSECQAFIEKEKKKEFDRLWLDNDV